MEDMLKTVNTEIEDIGVLLSEAIQNFNLILEQMEVSEVDKADVAAALHGSLRLFTSIPIQDLQKDYLRLIKEIEKTGLK